MSLDSESKLNPSCDGSDPALPRDGRRLAIFDLDGTLTTRDSFLGYLVTFGRRHRRFRSLGMMPFRITPYLLRLTRDYRLKESLIRDFFASVPMDVIHEHTRWFCQNWLPMKLHPVGTRVLDWHREQGDRLILLSASPEIAVPSIASALGFEEFVCTRLIVERGFYSGKIDGVNCKGAAKVAAIRAYLGCECAPTGSFAYGDSKSDRGILSWVENGAWVRARQLEPLAATSNAFPQLPLGG